MKSFAVFVCGNLQRVFYSICLYSLFTSIHCLVLLCLTVVFYQSEGDRFLIAPEACRTTKFIQCLLGDIPCVSDQWIIEIVKEGKRVEFDKFRLNAGSWDDEVYEWYKSERSFFPLIVSTLEDQK